MSCQELQEEEVEVLRSIYEGDSCFKEVSPTVFQYKIGDDGDHRAFLLEVNWGENYPDEIPVINLDAFYNKHVVSTTKSFIIDKVKTEAEPLVGTAMTYTLFEYAKENATELTEDQPEPQQQAVQENSNNKEDLVCNETAKVKVKKEQLTKQQKRKLFNRLDAKGDMARGWNWVDVVKHLSQSGVQPSKQNS